MDTSKLDNFVRIVQDESHNLKIVKLLRASDNLREYRRNIQHKETVFESAVVEFCCMYGDNANKALGLYRDKLICGYKRQQARSNQHSLSSLPESERNHINLFYRIFLSVILKAIKCLDNILSMDSSQELHQSKQKVYSINDDDLQKKKTEKIKLPYPHYGNKYTDEQLKYILKTLIERGYIACDTNESDFIYFFSGRGEVPKSGLQWNEGVAHVHLCAFLKKFFAEDKRIWNKAESIFNMNNLGRIYSRDIFNSTGEESESFFEKLEKSIKNL